MSEILRKFLFDDVRRLSPTGRFVGLAAFGKHPGWDDHVEDLGLETDSLNHAKIVFYVNGIGGQIDSGAWEKLEPAQQLSSFKHLFLWQRSGQILLGRLWSSSDGKGRKRYPMVVCLHFVGVTLRWALAQGLPALAELEAEIQKTNSAEEVRSLLNRKRASLREALPSADTGGEYTPVSPDALSKILHPPADPNSQSFLRVLYQMQSQFRTFAPGTFNARARPGSIRAQQIRVPSAAENPEQVLLFWTRFFLTQVDASVPLLLCLPLDEHWVDVTVGDPESHEFFSLRASPKAVPLVSEVPYTLDEAFLTSARAFLDAFQRGETSGFAAAQPARSEKSATPAKGGLLKWLGVGAIIALAGVAAIFFLGKGKPSTSEASKAPAPTNSSPSVVTQTASSAVARPEPVPKPIESVKSAPLPSTLAQIPAAGTKSETNLPPPVIQPSKPIEPVAVTRSPAPPVSANSDSPHGVPALAGSDSTPTNQTSPATPTDSATIPSPAPTAPSIASSNPAVQTAALTPVSPTTIPASTISPASPAPGTLMTNSIGMALVLMPSGFWVSKYELTWAEYGRIMDTTNADTRMPVNRVSWDDATEFCRRLTEKESATLKGKVYSLPTLKQWEEFRAGQKLEDLPQGSLKKSSQAASPVADTAPNKLGLFGVLGNVWEWCLDGGAGSAKLQKGGEYGSTNYDRSVSASTARINSGFRCVLVQK